MPVRTRPTALDIQPGDTLVVRVNSIQRTGLHAQ